MYANFNRLAIQGKEMNTNFVISMVTAVLLVPVVYSSSTSFVFAEVSCIDYDKKTKVCATSGGDMYDCVKQDDGKWKCTKIQPSDNVPPGLADALEDVTAEKVPNNGKILSENEEPGDNMTFSRANISALD